MAHYQQQGSIPPKRHTQHRRPGEGEAPGRAVLRGAHGRGGLLLRLLAALPPEHPVDHRRRPRVGGRRPRHHAEPPAGAAPPEAARPLRRRGGARHRRRHRPPAGARQRRRADLVCRGRGTQPVVPQRGGRRVRLHRARRRPGWRPSSGPSTSRRATTSSSRARRRTAGCRTASAEEPLRAYCIEANSHITPPKRYLSKYGQFLEHAPYCERDLRAPQGPLLAEDIGAGATDETEVFIKHRGNGPGGIVGTVHTLPFHPLDVVGWDGCLYPYAFNIRDYEPITGRVHQPPPVHQVFEAWNFVICNFVPRKVDYHPLAVPVPYYHSNVDSDEIMFYVDGDYEARKGSGIGRGSISVHPGGHAHGPQPGATEASLGVEYFDETAVMVDTFRPLELGEGGRAVDDGKYAWSWSGGRSRRRRRLLHRLTEAGLRWKTHSRTWLTPYHRAPRVEGPRANRPVCRAPARAGIPPGEATLSDKSTTAIAALASVERSRREMLGLAVVGGAGAAFLATPQRADAVQEKGTPRRPASVPAHRDGHDRHPRQRLQLGLLQGRGVHRQRQQRHRAGQGRHPGQGRARRARRRHRACCSTPATPSRARRCPTTTPRSTRSPAAPSTRWRPP